MKLVLALTALAFSAPVLAQDGRPFTVAESGRGFAHLQQAVDAIGGGDGTIRIAPGTYRECAIVPKGRVAFVATQPGTAIFDGVTCEGKAAIVLKGQDAHVEGLVFRNMAVSDQNGAGIRLEWGSLTVKDSAFRDSQEGILTADSPDGFIQNLTVEGSTFSGLGVCPDGGSCAHSIYVGVSKGTVIVRRSRFERGTGGHYLKTRAAHIEVTDTSFDDSRGRDTNYMIDLSGGANGIIARNIFVQGPSKENHTCFISVAPEGDGHPSAGLVIADNRATLAPGAKYDMAFVADWQHQPLKIARNRIGPGITPFVTKNR